MDRTSVVAACVAEMSRHPAFHSASDDHKAKAAAYAFEKLHEDAEQHLSFGASAEDVKHYAKGALKRVHQATNKIPAAEFEQANGFPILLVLSLLPTLWSWFKLLRSWMGWDE